MLVIRKFDHGYEVEYGNVCTRVQSQGRVTQIVADALANNWVPKYDMEKHEPLRILGKQVRLMSEEEVRRDFGLKIPV